MLASNSKLNEFIEKHGVGSGVSELVQNALTVAKSGHITIHPYGFYIIKCKNDLIKQVRIHVWLSNVRHRQEPDWPPHNHNFNLDSIVINGTLNHKIWRVEPSTDSLNMLYEVSYDFGISKLIKTTIRSECTESNSATYLPGDTYHLSKYEFHSVEVEKNMEATTLCIMKDPENDPQHVIGTVSGNTLYEFSRGKVTKKEQTSVIKILENILSKVNV